MELVHKIKETVLELNEQRKKGVAISFRQFFNSKFEGKTVEHLFAEANINPHLTTVEQLMESDETRYLMSELILESIRRGWGMQQREQLAAAREQAAESLLVTTDRAKRYITPEIIIDPVYVGAVASVFYPELVMRDVPVNGMKATIPRLKLSDARPKKTREAARIEVGTVSYDDKEVKLFDFAIGLETTYHAIKFNTLDLVMLFFEDMGRLLGSSLNTELELVAINGDQPDLSENCVVVGVSTVGQLQYKDVNRVNNRMRRISRVPTALLASEAMENDWDELPEVKNAQNSGAPLVKTNKHIRLKEADVYPGTQLTDNQIMLIDPSSAFVKLTAQNLMVETDKIINRRIEEAYASIITGFATYRRDARVIIDKSIAFNTNQFPAFMQLN